ncbi:hypothetical protein MWN33_15495 [Starkeya koreensis]|uniref:HAMP domain-containing protein n=1 Tax=Ancylobacter koreensis TaxID=266121 RepID=A0ABT0DQ85_9HYPH|nr:hypothetical protein [Ancylobacter koreensis]MCK0209438.1 hypothetical protein [Ancylobacter koreensis]
MPIRAPSRPFSAGSFFRSLRASLHATTFVTLSLLISLAFVLALATLLNYSKFLTTYTELSDRRVALVTTWTRDSIEVLLNLGLELKGLHAASAILEQAKTRYPHIESISLFDTASGRILYSTSPELLGKPTPHAWLEAQAHSTRPTWNIAQEDPAVAGVRLDSSFLKGLGGIAIVHSTTQAREKIARMRDELVMTALGVFGAFAVLAVALALLATRGMRRTLRGLTEALDPSTGTPAKSQAPPGLRGPLSAFRQAVEAAESELAGAEKELGSGAPREGAEGAPAPAGAGGARP